MKFRSVLSNTKFSFSVVLNYYYYLKCLLGLSLDILQYFLRPHTVGALFYGYGTTRQSVNENDGE
jgi:hypothetical protein